MGKRLPKGFKCQCGAFHVFSGWVFAHWAEDLVHTCEGCGRKHSIERGKATMIPVGMVPRKRKRR